MIARLAGRVVEREATRGIVDVAGVGYEVFATNRALDVWMGLDAVVVYVSTQVREDAITLYGFPSDLERRTFVVLMGVSGFGPKTALSTLDALAVDELHRAVEGDDLVTLGRIPGVGAKKAQRLALELKGRIPVSFDVPQARAARVAKAADALPLALAQLEYGRSEIERALVGLEQRGIAGAHGVVDDPLKNAGRAASLDDLALDEIAPDPESETRDAGAWRQGERVAAFEHLRRVVAELFFDLGAGVAVAHDDRDFV